MILRVVWTENRQTEGRRLAAVYNVNPNEVMTDFVFAGRWEMPLSKYQSFLLVSPPLSSAEYPRCEDYD